MNRLQPIVSLGGAIVLLCLTAGCGRKPAPRPADADQGRSALQAALTAWQQGRRSEQLREQQPAIIVNDPEWLAGRRLLRFQLADKHEYHGSQLRCAVTLTLQEGESEPREKKVTYLVDTSPALVIVRGDP